MSDAPYRAPHPPSHRPPASPLPRAAGRFGPAAPLAALAAAGGAFAYVGAVDPNRAGHYPACPLLALTGIYCPGCGGLRTVHALAHGDPVTALGANAMVVAGAAVLGVLWIAWMIRTLRPRPHTMPRPRPQQPHLPPSRNARNPLTVLTALAWPLRAPHWWVLGGLVLVFTVVRNLPFGAALAP